MILFASPLNESQSVFELDPIEVALQEQLRQSFIRRLPRFECIFLLLSLRSFHQIKSHLLNFFRPHQLQILELTVLLHDLACELEANKPKSLQEILHILSQLLHLHLVLQEGQNLLLCSHYLQTRSKNLHDRRSATRKREKVRVCRVDNLQSGEFLNSLIKMASVTVAIEHLYVVLEAEVELVGADIALLGDQAH